MIIIKELIKPSRKYKSTKIFDLLTLKLPEFIYLFYIFFLKFWLLKAQSWDGSASCNASNRDPLESFQYFTIRGLSELGVVNKETYAVNW